MANTGVVKVSAPGKILWIGGYSVLERPNIAYVTAVDAKVTAQVRIRKDNVIKFEAPQLKMKAGGTTDTRLGTIDIDVPSELLLMKTSAELALRYVAAKGVRASGFEITTRSDKRFAYSVTKGRVVKSGLGSSAAVTVAIVGAMLEAYGTDKSENDALHKLSQAAHSIATGKVGSGFDIAASTYGSILYSRYSPDILKKFPKDYTNKDLMDLVARKWDYGVERFPLPEEFKIVFANFGKSMITTQAIGNMQEFKTKDPMTYGELVRSINDENRNAVYALRKLSKGDNSALEDFVSGFERGRRLTKKLGVLSGVGIEPDDCTALIDESRKKGALVAKLPGAGGRDAIAALTHGNSKYASLRNFWKKRSELEVMDIDSVDSGALKSQE